MRWMSIITKNQDGSSIIRTITITTTVRLRRFIWASMQPMVIMSWIVPLAEGIHLCNVERNGDVVEMTSYAPLLCKNGYSNWNPDMIYFDNSARRFVLPKAIRCRRCSVSMLVIPILLQN